MASIPKASATSSKGSSKSQKTRYTLDCTTPANDNIVNTSGLEKYLRDKMKVDGKAGNLGDKISIAREKNKIIITVGIPFSKRYIKYLTKKYLKKQQLRDFLRVVATKEHVYELRYFQINEGVEE